MAPRRAAALRAHGGDGDPTLREHLVAMTGQLLDDVSLTTLTTREIARHAGVSDGVLYNHFADKNELLIATLMARYERLVAKLETDVPAAGQGSVESNLRTIVRSLTAFHEAILLIGAGLLADPKLLERFWAEMHRPPHGPGRLMRPLATYLAAERDEGRLAAAIDVEAVVTLTYGASAVLGLTRRLNADMDDAWLDPRVNGIVATLLGGIAT